MNQLTGSIRMRARHASVYLMRLAAAALGTAMSLASVPAQEPVTRIVPAADAEIRAGFTAVAGLRELSDGRVLVGDNRERLLRLADFRTGTDRALGREGQGPNEFGSVGTVLAAEGDTSFMVDVANARLLVISPDGGVVGTISLAASGASLTTRGTTAGAAAMRPRFVPRFRDERGNLYDAGRVQGSDSLVLRRWQPPYMRADTMARVASGQVGGSLGNRTEFQAPNPFGARDAWVVSPDGHLAIVRVGTYHVEWVSPAGAVVSGEALPFRRVRVSEAEKAAYVARLRAAIASSGRRTSIDPGKVLEEAGWPEFKPAFEGEVHHASDGNLWVPLAQENDEDAQIYDVMDRQGRLLERVQLPPRTAVVGFGRNAVYTVRRDAVDLLHLQRRPLR